MSGGQTAVLAATHSFAPAILREYDIRGTVGKNLSHQDAYFIGRGFASRLLQNGGGCVAVGYDGRLSSLDLEAALVRGLSEGGVDVVRIGLGPSPMLYFAAATLPVSGGIMVTGSHNPAEDNGFKFVLNGGPFFGAEIKHLAEVAGRGEFLPPARAGSIADVSVQDRYIERLASEFPVKPALRIVWDCGNGATGEIVRRLTEMLPGHHVLLFAEIDGRFPNHHPDPTEPANLVALQHAVAEHNADFGVAFDGDGDRIGAVDHTGRIIWGDQLLLLFAAEILEHRPGASIIADVKASQVFFDGVRRLGGKPVMYRTGHSLIKTKMREIDAPLAGEMSGHIFFADRWFGFDDALYAAMRLSGLSAAGGEKWLARQLDELPVFYNTPEIRIDCRDEMKFKIVDAIRRRVTNDGYEFNGVDGLRVSFREGWWLLRASNTQPVLVARCEAITTEELSRLKKMLLHYLQAEGIALSF